jgi:hypothetical protein
LSFDGYLTSYRYLTGTTQKREVLVKLKGGGLD